MKKLIAICAFCAAFCVAEPLTWNRLLSSVDEDPALKASAGKQSALGNRSGTKLWNDLELNYKLDGFGFMDHDFELRVKPKAFGEGAADDAYWNAQLDYQKFMQNYDRAQIIYERYQHALHYILRCKIQELHQQLYAVNEDRIAVLRAKSGSETFDLQDLVDALERQASLTADLISDSNSIEDSKMKLRSFVADFDSIALDTAWLPTIEELSSTLKDGDGNLDKYPDVARAKAKWAIDDKKYAQEVNEGRDYISHIGLGYEYIRGKYKYDWVTESSMAGSGTSTEKWKLVRKDDDRRTCDKFYLTLAVKIPAFSDDRSDEIKRQVDVLESERDYLEEKRDASQKVARIREEIFAIIAQRNVQKDFVDKVNAGALFQDFAIRTGSDPLLLLRARESALESLLKIAKLDDDIYNDYIELLNYNGGFLRTDVANQLKAGVGK
jgi:hypothetical protein